MNKYLLQISGGITDRTWALELSALTGSGAAMLVPDILRGCRIAAAATKAALWDGNKLVAEWRMDQQVRVVKVLRS